MTLKDLVIEKKCRKGESSGRNKKGSYWECLKVKTATYGGDGIGQSGADIDWKLVLRHYRNGEVQAILHRHSWHQNDGSHHFDFSCSDILEMCMIEDVLDHIASLSSPYEYGERMYVDSSYREETTKALEQFGLPHAKAPDEA